MAHFLSSQGVLSWICEGETNLLSFCFQRSIIDGMNIIFFCVFYLFMLISLIRKYHSNSNHHENNQKDRIMVVASICCFLTCIMYLGTVLYDFIDRDGEVDHLSWIIRGLTWTSFAVSLLTQNSKWILCLTSVWWICLCVLLSILNIEALMINHTIPLFDLIPWLVSFLLLHCAFRNYSYFNSARYRKKTMLEESLLCESEKESIIQPQTGLNQANFLNRFTFSWLNPLLSLGYEKLLVLQDIPSLPNEDKANSCYQKFVSTRDSLLRRSGSSSNISKNLLILTMSRAFLKENIYIAIYALVRTISAAVGPLLVYAFVSHASRELSEDEYFYEGLTLLACLVFVKFLETVSERQWYFESRRSGMRMRSALVVAVYEKLLNLSSFGRKRHSNGEIVNYIAVDAYRMGEFLYWFHSGWCFVLQILLSVCVLFWVVGLSAIPGLILLIIFGVFFNVPYAKKIKNCKSEVLKSQDERLRLTSEILNNIKIIKLQAWEDKFMNMIESIRDTEFKWLAQTQFTKAFGAILYVSPSIIGAVVLIACYLFNTAPLNAATIFTVLATLKSVAEPVRFIPEAVSVIIQVKVSFDRLNSFLLDNQTKIGYQKKNIYVSKTGNCIEIQESDFSWDEDSVKPTLREINLVIKHGEKVAVCGPVGAGKSSLLHAILGEMPKICGTVKMHGEVAYVSQNSWIQSGTIRDNILFGKPMERNRYESAIKACALDKDIDGFSHGDLTEIGQRGLNLSGGQKQRIQLARAVYNDADVYLLDDPFSAVDAHTASILFHDCVMNALKKKTVILVTHQVEFLSEVDKILVMEGGVITQAGSHEELLTSGTTFEQLMNAHRDAIAVIGTTNSQNQEMFQETDEVDGPVMINNNEEICETSIGCPQLTEEEYIEIGTSGWELYLDYIIISKGMFLQFLSLIALIGFTVCSTGASYWIAVSSEISSIDKGLMVVVYTGMSILSAVFAYLRSILVVHLGLKASKAFFSGFTSSIFNAPMSFFDSTPVGRILTRASSDFDTLDFDVPFAAVYVAQSAVVVLTGIAIMTSVTWQILIVAIITAVTGYYIKEYYQATARELVRINGTTKAPVVSFTTETSAGVVTVRAFKMVDRFFKNFLHIVDTDAALFLHTNAALEWLQYRVDILQNVILFTAACLFVFLPMGSIAPGLVGLSLSYALSLTRSQMYYNTWSCNMSNFIISVERIKQFMQIPQEPPKIMEYNRPPSSWPSKGRIEFHDLMIRYRPNAPLVLNGITCTFKEGTRVGVVGRTGSGKTTLLSALFRLVEPTYGEILIDGLNIRSIGLKDLRMKLSIIPQEPILFRGSVRTNLDPLDQFSDDEIWKVLEMCQLKEFLSGLPHLLDSSVSNEGENWSMGQRQLFCLGRVLLKRNRILVLDEATASIDSTTDAILQKIIRQEFAECTVITVAHRVPTVIDSDMVMVLSYGKLVEYDEPSKLMEDNSSSFSKLVAEYWSSCMGNS